MLADLSWQFIAPPHNALQGSFKADLTCKRLEVINHTEHHVDSFFSATRPKRFSDSVVNIIENP
jgi:hypothetical protein